MIKTLKKTVSVALSCVLTLLGATSLGGCAYRGDRFGDTVAPTNMTTAISILSNREIQTVGQTYKGTDVVYPDSLWSAPEYAYESTLDFGMEGTEGVQGLFFTSPITYNGKRTKVAAYIGFPSGASAENKVPAIVLVHGGLGTAVPQWVKYWNDLGFAAISLDTEGGEPINGISNYDTLNYHLERNRYADGADYEAGPTNNGFTDWEKPIEDQWMYHATSATIAAVSLISSFDCVDTQRIGMTGISWGSVITSLVISYDDRVSFAMPVYGGLSLAESYAEFKTIHPNETSANRWDTLEGLRQSNCKTYYVTSDADYAFSMDVANRSATAVGGAVNFKNGFTHGQAQGAYEENLPLFARYMCGIDTKYVEIAQQPTREAPTVKLALYGGAKIDSVWLYYTSDEQTDADAAWYTKFVSFEHATEYALEIPDGTAHAYVRVRYDNDNTVCTYIF